VAFGTNGRLSIDVEARNYKADTARESG